MTIIPTWVRTPTGPKWVLPKKLRFWDIIITSLSHHYYSLLQFHYYMLLHHYYIIITLTPRGQATLGHRPLTNVWYDRPDPPPWVGGGWRPGALVAWALTAWSPCLGGLAHWIFRHYYTIIMSLLHYYYMIIIHYYNFIITHYYTIITSLHHFYIIITH